MFRRRIISFLELIIRGAIHETVLARQNLAFPLQPASLSDLVGGDRLQNASIIRQILSGEERGPKRDAVLLNAAAAFFVAGRVADLSEGWETAAAVIDNGLARKKLAELTHS